MIRIYLNNGFTPPPLKKRLISVTDEVSREICVKCRRNFFLFLFLFYSFLFFLVFSSFSFLFSYIFPTPYTSCSGG